VETVAPTELGTEGRPHRRRDTFERRSVHPWREWPASRRKWHAAEWPGPRLGAAVLGRNPEGLPGANGRAARSRRRRL